MTGATVNWIARGVVALTATPVASRLVLDRRAALVPPPAPSGLPRAALPAPATPAASVPAPIPAPRAATPPAAITVLRATARIAACQPPLTDAERIAAFNKRAMSAAGAPASDPLGLCGPVASAAEAQAWVERFTMDWAMALHRRGTDRDAAVRVVSVDGQVLKYELKRRGRPTSERLPAVIALRGGATDTEINESKWHLMGRRGSMPGLFVSPRAPVDSVARLLRASGVLR